MCIGKNYIKLSTFRHSCYLLKRNIFSIIHCIAIYIMIFVCEKKNWCVSKTTTLKKLLHSSSCEATKAITQEDIRNFLSGIKYDPSRNRS